MPFSDAKLVWTQTDKGSNKVLNEAVPPEIQAIPEPLFSDHTVPGAARYNLRPQLRTTESKQKKE